MPAYEYTGVRNKVLVTFPTRRRVRSDSATHPFSRADQCLSLAFPDAFVPISLTLGGSCSIA